MGGCATKPKDLNSEFTDAPAPSKEDTAGTVTDVKEGAVVEESKKVDKKAGEFNVDVEEADDENGNKRRSLSNLFKEKEDGEDSGEKDDKTLVESVKQEPSKTTEVSSLPETKSQESEKKKSPAEKPSAPVDVAPVASKAEKIVEVGTAVPIKKTEAEAEEKQPEDTDASVDKKTEENKGEINGGGGFEDDIQK